MSTCISQHGEYSAHTPDDTYTCTLCGALDEQGLLDEIERLTRWQAEAMTVMDGLQDLGEALGLPLGERVTGPAALAAVERLKAYLASSEADAQAVLDYMHEQPAWCGRCGDHLAATTCTRCHGSGCLPNAELAYLECDECAGAGKIHEGCVEQTYAQLAAKVARVEALAEEWSRAPAFDTERNCAQELRAALAGGEQ